MRMSSTEDKIELLVVRRIYQKPKNFVYMIQCPCGKIYIGRHPVPLKSVSLNIGAPLRETM